MRYEADGESWDVYLSRETPHEGVRPVVFHCTSNSSHGWRVVEVPASEFASGDDLSRLDDDRLDELFARSQPFDYAHDSHAVEGHIGDPGVRRSNPAGDTGRP